MHHNNIISIITDTRAICKPFYGKNLFGPYVLQERSIDGEKYVRPDSGIQKYVLTFYNENDYIFHTFPMRQAHPFPFVFFSVARNHYLDNS